MAVRLYDASLQKGHANSKATQTMRLEHIVEHPGYSDLNFRAFHLLMCVSGPNNTGFTKGAIYIVIHTRLCYFILSSGRYTLSLFTLINIVAILISPSYLIITDWRLKRKFYEIKQCVIHQNTENFNISKQNIQELYFPNVSVNTQLFKHFLIGAHLGLYT